MRHAAIDRLADILVSHSCRVLPGEAVLVEGFDLPDTHLVAALVERIAAAGGLPVVDLKSNRVLRKLFSEAGEAAHRLIGELESARMARMAAYIGIRGADNALQMSDVPPDRMDSYLTHWHKPTHLDIRVPRTKWVVLRYPTPAMAQAAGMSDEAFERFYFDVCTADYAAMAEAMRPLVARMEAARQVRITGPGTELEFSIAGIPVVPCAGEHNIPDGEVFTCPVRDSANGTIAFNVPSLYQGMLFDKVQLTFERGRIVAAEAGAMTDKLNRILDTDDGARHLGEWSIAVNNQVRRPMMDILFDEKIGGSFHLTPGNAYDEADNGNRSKVHWDMVMVQTAGHGGGEIRFDGELVRRDGLFLPPELAALNAGL